MRQHDAHVRARKRLLTRIVDRAVEWGAASVYRRRGDTHEAALARVADDCRKRLASFRWPPGWEVKRGRYYVVGGADVVGQYADVPSQVIHSIMCSPLEDR
jgi:hypothetical protein